KFLRAGVQKKRAHRRRGVTGPEKRQQTCFVVSRIPLDRKTTQDWYQVFCFGRSPRTSRNSFGPLRRRRFRVLRSSSGVDGSISLSISWAANSSALDAASRFRHRKGCDAASPSSRSRRIASEGELRPFSSAHLSIAAVS